MRKYRFHAFGRSRFALDLPYGELTPLILAAHRCIGIFADRDGAYLGFVTRGMKRASGCQGR